MKAGGPPRAPSQPPRYLLPGFGRVRVGPVQGMKRAFLQSRVKGKKEEEGEEEAKSSLIVWFIG